MRLTLLFERFCKESLRKNCSPLFIKSNFIYFMQSYATIKLTRLDSKIKRMKKISVPQKVKDPEGSVAPSMLEDYYRM